MKLPQKLEPYQRSRQRAALHAWVVAATAVASIGMPMSAVALGHPQTHPSMQASDQTPSQAAERVAADWLEALRTGDRHAALSSMRLPALGEHERAVLDEMGAMSDWLSQGGIEIEPVAHRHSGHWALSAWRLDAPAEGLSDGEGGMIEPITLYNPAGDALTEVATHWEVVPQGFEDDPALAPLYNADHAELVTWYETLV